MHCGGPKAHEVFAQNDNIITLYTNCENALEHFAIGVDRHSLPMRLSRGAKQRGIQFALKLF